MMLDQKIPFQQPQQCESALEETVTVKEQPHWPPQIETGKPVNSMAAAASARLWP